MRLLFRERRFAAMQGVSNLHGAFGGGLAGDVAFYDMALEKILTAGVNEDAKSGLGECRSQRLGGLWRIGVGLHIADDRNNRVFSHTTTSLDGERQQSRLPCRLPAKPHVGGDHVAVVLRQLSNTAVLQP
jgi:hypothetical protein